MDPDFLKVLCHTASVAFPCRGFFKRAVGCGGAGGAIAPPIFLDMRKKVVFSTPIFLDYRFNMSQKSLAPPMFHTFLRAWTLLVFAEIYDLKPRASRAPLINQML